tara:strand:+ start:9798 stop:9944 length:147 start_codon:yes stop_codon:yes gene_type:complete
MLNSNIAIPKKIKQMDFRNIYFMTYFLSLTTLFVFDEFKLKRKPISAF